MKPAINMKALRANLRDALCKYRAERPHLSLRAIAKNSGCNRYFLMKLIDENEANTSLDLNQVLNLSQFISGRSSFKEAAEVFGKEGEDVLAKTINLDYYSQKRISAKMNQLNLYDSYTYFVLVFASYAQGTKREYITKILGYQGEQTLKKLLNEQIVIEENGRIRLKEGDEFTLSTEIMKQRIPDYLKYHSFDRCFQNQQKNFICVYSEGLNEAAVKKIHALHANLNSEIQKILMNKKNYGDVPFFSFACMDRFYDCEEDSQDEAIDEEVLENETFTEEFVSIAECN